MLHHWKIIMELYHHVCITNSQHRCFAEHIPWKKSTKLQEKKCNEVLYIIKVVGWKLAVSWQKKTYWQVFFLLNLQTFLEHCFYRTPPGGCLDSMICKQNIRVPVLQRCFENPVGQLQWSFFAKIVNGWKPLIIVAKKVHLRCLTAL